MENTMSDKKIVNEQLEKSKPLFIVSDFHGVYDAMDIVKSNLNDYNKRVVILGDCMDRGNGGMKILSEIKSMAEDGASIMYLPGNHDDALYTKFRTVVTRYRELKKSGNISDDELYDMQEIIINIIRSSKFEGFAKGNGQIPTLEGIKSMCDTSDGVRNFLDLMLWLEEQPLLRIEVDCDGRKVAMGHAAFDMDLYNQEEPLTLRSKAMIDMKYEELKEKKNETREFAELKKQNAKAFACLWYRNPNDSDSVNFNNVVTLPNESEADVIVVGHTPEQMEIEIVGENITRKAIDVDGGTVKCYLSGEGKMLKFEPHRESLPTKEMVVSFVVVGRKGAYEKLGLDDEYEPDENDNEQEEDEVKIYVPGSRKKQNIAGEQKKVSNQDNSNLGDDFGEL